MDFIFTGRRLCKARSKGRRFRVRPTRLPPRPMPFRPNLKKNKAGQGLMYAHWHASLGSGPKTFLPLLTHTLSSTIINVHVDNSADRTGQSCKASYIFSDLQPDFPIPLPSLDIAALRLNVGPDCSFSHNTHCCAAPLFAPRLARRHEDIHAYNGLSSKQISCQLVLALHYYFAQKGITTWGQRNQHFR